MKIRDIVVATGRVPKRERDEEGAVKGIARAAPPATVETPVFITPQTLVTFPGASMVVLIIWRTLGLAYPPLEEMNLVPIIAALIVGALIYIVSLSKEMTLKEKLIGAFLALINAMYIALFVLGVPVTFGGAGG
mgnify:CR=1 FL=1